MSKLMLDIVQTKRQNPAMWERGGAWTNTGTAIIIAGSNGERKKATYIKKRGSLACEDHALVIVSIGDIVIRTDHHRKDHHTEVIKIKVINSNRLNCECERIAEFSDGEWDYPEVAEKYAEAIKACQEKAEFYHCRNPYYVLES